MGKFLLFLIVVAVVWGLVKSRFGHARPSATPDPKPEQKMIACAHCGVYLPEEESVGDQTARYCSEAHRLAGIRKDG